MVWLRTLPQRMPEAACKVCGERRKLAPILGVCKECIVTRFELAKPYIREAHARVRRRFLLPPEPPKEGAFRCVICSRNCRIGNGETGYCGLRAVKNNRPVVLSTANRAPAYIYLDPHVTNCCASWFCPAGTGIGYPKFAVRPTAERGYYNLAVFFYGCNLNCLFCQNWEHKQLANASFITAEELAYRALSNPKITCVCYFGGSPEPHLPFVIRVNDIILREKRPGRVIRLCLEWNGAGNPKLVRKVGEQSLVSGGIIKFDIKAPNSELYYALTGLENADIIFDNFKMLYDEFWSERPEVPVLTATTLLVPGYIGPDEVEEIAKFIASIDENIPYSLLVFHPDFAMSDLPVTPKMVAYESFKRAKKHLKRVHLGNAFLLSVAPDDL